MPDRNVTVLWALRSWCASHKCPPCYFNWPENATLQALPGAGVLDHQSPHDVPTQQLLAFARTLGDSPVRRVFLAGGEPLLWAPVLKLIETLKSQRIEVVVCTSGPALNKPGMAEQLVDLGVDAFSVSLDSTDAEYNDRWRPPRKPGFGWEGVVNGIRTLLTARGDRPQPRVGIYSMITKLNLDAITTVPRLAADLGCDYFVAQPVSLPADHNLHDELVLNETDIPRLRREFGQLYASGLPLTLPSVDYPGQFVSAVQESTGLVRDCFGGNDLFFVEPDGSVWDCPSALRIAQTPPQRRRNIRATTAADAFRPAGCADCALFSVDCVNMWPLMGFDRVVDPTPAGSTS